MKKQSDATLNRNRSRNVDNEPISGISLAPFLKHRHIFLKLKTAIARHDL
jgi:hypothetical protein